MRAFIVSRLPECRDEWSAHEYATLVRTFADLLREVDAAPTTGAVTIIEHERRSGALSAHLRLEAQDEGQYRYSTHA